VITNFPYVLHFFFSTLPSSITPSPKDLA